MKKMMVLMFLAAQAALAGGVSDEIAKTCEVKARDTWYGHARTVFVFDGEEAWVVEPKVAAPGRPWSWTMEWPMAFVERTGAPALLAAGYHHVTLRPGFYTDGKFQSRPGNMTDARVARSRAFPEGQPHRDELGRLLLRALRRRPSGLRGARLPRRAAP